MKTSLLFLPFLAIAGYMMTLPQHIQKGKPATQHKKQSEGKNLLEPYDHFTYMRTYPYDKFDVAEYNRVMDQARTFGMVRAGNDWEVAGPLNINGRINSVKVHPANSNIIYAGTAFGGVFKTTDGGNNWTAMFDDEAHLPIGNIELDPADPNRVWVGTGDKNISGTCYLGGGIYLSTDAGATWTNKGLTNTYVISEIIVDPSNSNTIYAATMGNPFNADNNRGLYKSTDGGTTWTNKLFINDSTGVVDLIMDPNDENTLYATSFTRMRRQYVSTYHSDQCKVYKTTDGGNTWNVLGGGLPTGDVGRIGITISATNSNNLYAIVADASSYIEGVYKSTDAGATWVAKNSIDLETVGSCSGGFAWYFGKIHVNPSNDNIVYVYGVDKFISYDGGDSWSLFAPEWWTYEVHADGHDLAFIDDQNMIMATDGGLYKTTDNGFTWLDIDNMPSTQFYHVTHLPNSAETFYGGAQDNGTIGGSKYNSPTWNWAFGGDGFKFYATQADTNMRYYATQNGGIYFDDNGWVDVLDAAGALASDRFNWDTPYMLDRFDESIVYLGTEKMNMMTGAPYGVFSPMSGDLTDGPIFMLTSENTITTIDQNYFDQNKLYVGTGDANAWYTPDGGSNWIDISAGLPNRYVTSITASPNVNGNVYISFSGYRNNDNTPHIYKSTSNGTGWTSIQGDLPNFAINDILVFPGNESRILVGTDAGVYQTLDGGTTWTRFGNNMPQVAVLELQLNETNEIIAAATFGRGIMVANAGDISTISKPQTTSAVSVYPNPTTDYITVKGVKPNTPYYVFDQSGKRVMHGNIAGENDRINVGALSKAVYILSVQVGNTTESHRVVVR
ncbi:MAG TPA: T9SS type A sorting domain-containing protein [Flavobacteriales bacterium]|nr:T9SS type A sorting domain-containing protein [Flavobacteriales bacterium]